MYSLQSKRLWPNQRQKKSILSKKMLTVIKPDVRARTKNIIFKCKADKCAGYLQIQANETINSRACPECSTINCRTCEDNHPNLTCREYQRDNHGVINSGVQEADYNDEEWVCSNCTYVHDEKLNSCKICYMQRIVDQDNDTQDKTQYEKLLELQDVDIIRNTRKFQCITCFDEIEVGKGVKLHDCLHEFCENCLIGLIKASDQASITCPFREKHIVCEGTLQHREMKYLVDHDVFEQYLYRSLLHVQKDLKNCFQCKTPDCRGMWEYEDNVNSYYCPLCGKVNCHQCNAVHGTICCSVYQQMVYEEANPESLATRQMYEEMFANGKALHCPQCKIVIAREEGCSSVVCTVCKTEICWATRGPRWGPGGKGDTSGGCRCDYKNGKPCHPNCAYCH